MAGDRVEYRVAGEAMREALLRAASANGTLGLVEWKVLAAVMATTASWSRLEDTVSLRQLADAAGIRRKGGPREEAKAVAAALRHLEKAGALRYTPGGPGPGSRGRIALPEMGVRYAPITDPEMGVCGDRDGGPAGPEMGVQTPRALHTEKKTEKRPSGRRSGRAHDAPPLRGGRQGPAVFREGRTL